MQQIPMVAQGGTLAISYTLPEGSPYTSVHFKVLAMEGEIIFTKSHAAVKTGPSQYLCQVVVPPQVEPGLYRLGVAAMEPGVLYSEILFAVAPRVQECDVREKGVFLVASNRVDPAFSWELDKEG